MAGLSSPIQGAAPHLQARRLFFVVASCFLLALVLTGFSTTFYLRPWFDVPPIHGEHLPVYLILHGVVLTAWFVLFVVQATLVMKSRVQLHRRLGWIGTGLILLVVVSGAHTTYAVLDVALGLGFSVRALASLVIGNTLSLALFAGFTGTAIWLRRNPELHKRLMLLASVAIMSPVFGGEPAGRPLGAFLREFLPGGVLFAPYHLMIAAVVAALLAFDYASHRRLCGVTLIAAALLVAKQVLQRWLAPTEFGESVIRMLT